MIKRLNNLGIQKSKNLKTKNIMKINWGKGIVIAIVFFVSFIMYFVITMTTDNDYNHDLVTEKYYEKELGYQDKINASKNAQDLREKISYKRVKDGLLIQFPETFKNTALEGKVFLYRPSDKQLDFEIPLSNIQNYLLVPDKHLSDGRWNISIEIKHQKVDYLFTDEIVY